MEQNYEEHVKNKPEFDVFSVTVACKLHNLGARCADWIVQRLMITVLCTGELGKHDKLPTEHINEKNFHNPSVFHKPFPVLYHSCYSQIHLLVIYQRILISYLQISSHTSESFVWYYFPSQLFYTNFVFNHCYWIMYLKNVRNFKYNKNVHLHPNTLSYYVFLKPLHSDVGYLLAPHMLVIFMILCCSLNQVHHTLVRIFS